MLRSSVMNLTLLAIGVSKMIPRIKVNVGAGLDPVEIQQVIDTDLQTIDKTVVGAINELLDKVEELEAGSGESAKPVVNADTHYDFPAVGSTDVIYKAQSEKLLYQWNPIDLKYEVLGEVVEATIDVQIINGGDANGANA